MVVDTRVAPPLAGDFDRALGQRLLLSPPFAKDSLRVPFAADAMVFVVESTCQLSVLPYSDLALRLASSYSPRCGCQCYSTETSQKDLPDDPNSFLLSNDWQNMIAHLLDPFPSSNQAARDPVVLYVMERWAGACRRRLGLFLDVVKIIDKERLRRRRRRCEK